MGVDWVGPGSIKPKARPAAGRANDLPGKVQGWKMVEDDLPACGGQPWKIVALPMGAACMGNMAKTGHILCA